MHETSTSTLNHLTDDDRPIQPVVTPQVFNEPEAASWLRVSRVTLQRIRLRGEIAFTRIGGTRVVYTLKQLTDYLAAHERPALA